MQKLQYHLLVNLDSGNDRQRIRLSLLDSMSDECPTCHGAGKIISLETLITRIDHWLRRYKRNSVICDFGWTHPKMQNFWTRIRKKYYVGLCGKTLYIFPLKLIPL
ncbi:MAG: hypothetical protein Ct9H300mP23_06150 [Nitrospinota bacterium]|nr:MAG: hypothetical protein Ct9H300mP23_06150 [Nitrospinota bacterium]